MGVLSPEEWTALWLSLQIAGLATLVSLPFAIAAAWVLARCEFPGKAVFDGLQEQVATNRAQCYRDLPAGPFYGFNRPGAKVSEGVIQNWWRQGMMGGAKAHYDGIVAFSQTDSPKT